ncbi:EamA/RhaT family transporter [Martelella lutilitoris]|uniref:EamA/RhaT family transporter n=1 Tax=Martelella lutilitoris TaxID=2583532 RepID=A0A5C4JV70_9HYPH|nr:DMT family transporter [Martelella lutilitoris]TNB49255.1 EamA/RhaT family transporter [Martelella lutilitoris]
MSVSNDTVSVRAPNTDTAALGLSALSAVFWGTNFEATRIALSGLPPWTAAALRFAIAAVAILFWLRLSSTFELKVLKRNLPAFLSLGIVGVAGFNAALFLGMRTSSPVTAALIMGTTPLTTNLIESILQRRLPSTGMVLGMAISLFGVALTVGAFSGARFTSGDILILAGSLAWALYTIGCRRIVRDATPMETTAWTMTGGAVTLLLAAFFFETPFTALANANAPALGAVLWMSLVGSVLAYIFWQIGIARRGPGATSVVFNLVPVSALVVASLFGRMPDLFQIGGVAIAIFGILLASCRIPLPGRRYF